MSRKILLVIAVCFFLVGCSGPWEDLSKLYETPENPKPTIRAQSNKTVVLSGKKHKGAQTFRGIVTSSFDDTGVCLSLESPYSWLHKPLRIPLSAITACSRTQWSSGWDTNLWIDEALVEIAFPDNDQSVLNWCSTKNITKVNRETARKWLYEKEE